jgi:cellulose synthase/poly-beta-1,6-N-acetylglucosamine synthase-like glycosyltransferase
MTVTSLLVIVPCHNEEQVIARKLRNLATVEGSPRVVVVDDGSSDATAERAGELCEELFDVGRAAVVRNDGTPGKSGAIARGLAELEGEALVVLTDADVVFEAWALVNLAAAFERDPRLGMACGAQRFVTELSDTTIGDEAGGLYDRWTAAVRALESRFGALVSVHGQLLAWRASLGIAPTPGMAADDLDLMLQVRGHGARIQLVPDAFFYEERPGPSAEREAQALRRARAYVQFLDHPRIGELSGLHGAFYRFVPTATPRLVPVALLLLSGVLLFTLGPMAAASVIVLAFALLATPVGRRFVSLLRVIVSAVHAEASGGMTDRWETARN